MVSWKALVVHKVGASHDILELAFKGLAARINAA
jgi:hypothetical protein